MSFKLKCRSSARSAISHKLGAHCAHCRVLEIRSQPDIRTWWKVGVQEIIELDICEKDIRNREQKIHICEHDIHAEIVAQTKKIHEQEIRKQEIRKQEIREKEIREHEIHEKKIRLQKIREQNIQAELRGNLIHVPRNYDYLLEESLNRLKETYKQDLEKKSRELEIREQKMEICKQAKLDISLNEIGTEARKTDLDCSSTKTEHRPGLVETIGDEAENHLQVLEKMGVKNARKKLAQIRSDNVKIKALTKRIENRKHQMEGLGVSMSGDWNISVTVPKMSQEVNDPTKKLFSQPFFLEKYRYKLCLQVSMDGSGGSLSVFVHIMKGNFDSILDWPFVHRIAIKVKNQKEGEDSVHIVQPESTTIKKPEADQNITFGSRNFPTYSELVTGGFVRDDSISIQCEVLWN